FYIFPCSHAFHSKCLRDHILPHLTEDQQKAIRSLVD
ncbi:unnamed protein product, partial [Choristocarpus tenellus]